MTDEQRVRERWDDCEVAEWYQSTGRSCAVQAWTVRLSGGWVSPVGSSASDEKMWSAAWEFTQEHAEKIRQLEREIELQHKFANWYDSQARWSMRGGLADSSGGECRDEATIRRTLQRLEAALAELKRGWKEQS